MKHFVIITKLWGGGSGRFEFSIFFTTFKKQNFYYYSKGEVASRSGRNGPTFGASGNGGSGGGC
jgi:hypothetical protein